MVAVGFDTADHWAKATDAGSIKTGAVALNTDAVASKADAGSIRAGAVHHEKRCRYTESRTVVTRAEAVCIIAKSK